MQRARGRHQTPKAVILLIFTTITPYMLWSLSFVLVSLNPYNKELQTNHTMLHSYGAWICPQCGWTNSDLADYCPNPECIYGRGDEPSTANEVQGDQNIPKDAKVKRGEDDSFGREAKDRHQRQPRLERGNSTSQTKASTEHSLISDTTTEAIKTPITDSIISQHDGRRASAEHALDDSKELIEQPEIRPARDIILHPRKTSSKVLTSEDTEMEYQSQASFYGRDDKTKVIASIDHDTDVDTSELYVSKLRPIIVLDDDNESVISDTHSVSSIESQGSSSTRLSEQSPYDSRQIITATRELTLIFHQDETLIPLYQSAIENDKIGSERLQRNLRRLFKGYSKNLKNEAKDQLEYYSALFVGSKAKTLAESIIEKFGDLSVGNKKSDRETKEESSDEESRPVNDDVFADLVIFRNFLVRSEAFQTLHSQIHQFVLPEVVLEQERQSPEQISNEYHEQLTDGFGGFEADTQLVLEKNCDPQLGIRNSWGQQIKKHWESFAVATGHLEPTLEPGKQRLRWKCKCGMPFFGDVAELRPGGIADLKTNMERSSGVEFEKEGNSGSNTERRYRYQTLLLWLRDSLSRLGDGIRKRSNTPVLPRSNPSLVTSGQTALGNNVQPQTLHIMTCMQKGKYGKKLYQDLIKDVITDLQLFHFLKDRYVAHKGKFKGVLTLYSIKGIFFVKVTLTRTKAAP